MNEDEISYGGKGEQQLKDWIDEFFQVEEEVNEVLKSIRSHQLSGEHDKSQNKLYKLYDNRLGAFITVILSVLGSEDFYQDVESSHGEEKREALESLGDKYSDLEQTLRRAYMCYGEKRKNAISHGDVSYSYDFNEKHPIIEYKLYAGEEPVLETIDSPSRFIYISDLFLDAAVSTLERSEEQNIPISDLEKEKLAESTEELEKTLSGLKQLSCIEQSDSDDDPN